MVDCGIAIMHQSDSKSSLLSCLRYVYPQNSLTFPHSHPEGTELSSTFVSQRRYLKHNVWFEGENVFMSERISTLSLNQTTIYFLSGTTVTSGMNS